MESTSGVRTDPGPTSTKTRAPSRYIASIMSPNRTGLARWSPSRAAIAAGSSGVGGRIEIGVHGPIGRLAEQPLAPARANGSRAAATSGVWNADETGKSRPEIPRLAARSSAWLHGFGWPGDHGLPGTIPVGGLDAGNVADEPLDIGGAGQEGRHRAGLARAGFVHQAAALD